MKKLLSLCLLSFTILQSCTQDELDVAPALKADITTPAGISLSSVAKQMSENFALAGVRTILLKPVDSDPNTHLTTVYYVDQKGGFGTLLENFEVRQVEVTKSGIYVVTNYTEGGQPIAFFAKYDNSWTQVKGVGNYVGAFGDDIIFSDGSILVSKTLKVMKSPTKVITSSENLVLIKNQTAGTHGIVNTQTGVIQPVAYGATDDTELFSLSDDRAAVLVQNGNFIFISMITGEEGYQDGINPTFIYNPRQIVRDINGHAITILGEEYPNNENSTPIWPDSDNDGISDGYEDDDNDGIPNQYEDEDENGIPDTTYHPVFPEKRDMVGTVSVHLDLKGNVYASPNAPSEWDGTPLVNYTGDTLIKWLLTNNKILDVVSAYQVMNGTIYYSGTKGGVPQTGMFGITSKVNTILEKKQVYSSIRHLL